MNTKSPVKLIKKADREVPGLEAEIESAGGPNTWSTAVRAWISEFQEDRRTEPLLAFESLFKDELP